MENQENFESINDMLLYMLNHNLPLGHAELYYIFSNRVKEFFPQQSKLSKSVLTLLSKMEGEARNTLIQLLNSDFKYKPAWWKVKHEVCSDRFDAWRIQCLNPETASILIQTAESYQEREENANIVKNDSNVDEITGFRQIIERYDRGE